MEQNQSIAQLQLLEQNIQAIIGQKQQFQLQLNEVSSALSELEHNEEAYKIVGNIMVKTSREQLQKELHEKKEMVQIRIKALEKQEAKEREKISELQKDAVKDMQ